MHPHTSWTHRAHTSLQSGMVAESQLHLTLLTIRPVISDFPGFDFFLHQCQPFSQCAQIQVSSLKPHRLQGIQCSIQTIMGKTALRSRIRLRYVKENTLLYTRLNTSSHYTYTTNMNQAAASTGKNAVLKTQCRL